MHSKDRAERTFITSYSRVQLSILRHLCEVDALRWKSVRSRAYATWFTHVFLQRFPLLLRAHLEAREASHASLPSSRRTLRIMSYGNGREAMEVRCSS